MLNNLEKAVFDYENHFVGICELSKQYKIPNKTIREALENKGYRLGKGVSPKSVVFIKKAVDEYKEILDKGEEPNIYHLSQKYKVSHTSIVDNVKRAGLRVVRYPKIIQFDEHVFDVIDTEEKAYWLGFMGADGYICSRYNGVGLSLASKDVEHVKKYAKFLGCESNVKFHNNDKTGAYSCNVANAHLKSTLIKYGFTPNKSFDFKFPDESIFKTKDLIRHFIRGYFDGDGSITICRDYRIKTDDYRCTKQISILGTKEFLTKLVTYLDLNLNVRKESNTNCFVIATTCHKANKVLDYMYKDATVYLERKYKLYKVVAPYIEKSDKEKSTNIGESCDANTEITKDVKNL